jgi:hypothetical protein
MRNGIVVLGFFIIVLIVISGCTTQNETTAGSKSQNSASMDSTVKTSSASSYASPTTCKLLSVDPIRFQKFLPDVPGWTRVNGQAITPGVNYFYNPVPNGESRIEERYWQNPEDKINSKQVVVQFWDNGPCYTTSRGALFERMLERKDDINTITGIDNFHGYPAVKSVNFNTTYIYQGEEIHILISERQIVDIWTSGRGYTESEAEGNIEKFLSGTDLDGFASSI